MKTRASKSKPKTAGRGAADGCEMPEIPFKPMGYSVWSFDIHFFRSSMEGHLSHFAGFDKDTGDWRWCEIGSFDPLKNEKKIEGKKWKKSDSLYIYHGGISPLAWCGNECETYTIEAMNSICGAFEKRWACLDWTEEKEWLPIDTECVSEMINPYGGGGSFSVHAHAAKAFIEDVLSYPRRTDCSGDVTVGGKLFGDSNTFTIREFRFDDSGVGDIFNGIFSRFKAWIAWIGRRCGCRGKAEAVLGYVGEVYRWMCFCSSIDKAAFDGLRDLLSKLEKALFDMAVSVAGSTPTEKPKGQKEKPTGKRNYTARADRDGVEGLIYRLWLEYKQGENLEGTGQKRNADSFLKRCAGEVVSETTGGKKITLRDFVRNDAKSLRSIIKRMCENVRRRETRRV